MDETGMQNPIFNLAKTLQNQGGSNQNMMNNSMNPGMNPGMNQMQMQGTGVGGMNMGMNNMGMNNMGMNNMGMNNMGSTQMGMMNPMNMQGTGMGMNNMGMPNMNMGMNNMGMNNMGMPNMNMGMNNMGMNNMGTGMMNAAMNMNMNNQNNMNNLNNMNMNNNPPTTNSNQFINVYFRAGANGENGSIMIQCTLNDKVSDLIQKYKTKSLEDVSKKKFIFNAKALNPNLTVAEAGMQEGANIFVVNTAGVKGA